MEKLEPLPTLSYRNGSLTLLDQTELPARMKLVKYASAVDVAKAIKTMIVRGAPAIGVAAAYGVALEAIKSKHLPTPAFIRAIQHALDVLAASRPTAVNLSWALKRQRAILMKGGSPADVTASLEREARRIHEEDLAMSRRMGEFGAALVGKQATVLTHCNAGGLATAGLGTALAVIYTAAAQGKKLKIYADETRPRLQGAKLTAWELQKAGLDVTLISDNMAAYLMQQKKIDLIVVGADRIAANGDTANKIGTYGLAVAAKYHGVPFYVVAPSSTVDLQMPDGSHIPIEERAPEEMTMVNKEALAPRGIKVYNPAFDVTPAALISAIITDRGVCKAPYARSIAKVKQQEI